MSKDRPRREARKPKTIRLAVPGGELSVRGDGRPLTGAQLARVAARVGELARAVTPPR